MKRSNRRYDHRQNLASFIFLFFLLFSGIYISFITTFRNECTLFPETPSIKPTFFPDDDLLIDKVYTFHSGQLVISLSNLSFDAKYVYNIRLAQVTENEGCEMRVDLFDPNGDEYNIFRSEEQMSYEEYYEIPFGAALSGDYIINFTKLAGPNVNIHITISKGDLCYREFVSGDTNLVYEVKKLEYISYGKNYKPYYMLREQWRYNIYLCRVSPISVNYSNEITLDHNIIDPSDEDVSFPIYHNKSLGNVWEPLEYSFGTALAGEYLFNLTFYMDPAFINVMILITDGGELATGDGGEPTNQTAPDPGLFASIPFEAQVGIGIGIGALTILGLVILFYTKRQSNI
ncbi:MAG: hypothetical protein GF311_14490 [Candidatus Lokiarchaeota archaeon]|nr:hypothetical protein [Candidatus Lokiarchaeota archaeon]